MEDIFKNKTYARSEPRNLTFRNEVLYYIQDGALFQCSLTDNTRHLVSLPPVLTDKKISDLALFSEGEGMVITADGTPYWLEGEKVLASLPPGSRFALSPSGSGIAYTDGYNISLMDREGKPRPITTDGTELVFYGQPDWVYEEEFELSETLFFSPDGRYLVFFRFNESEVPRYPLNDDPLPHSTVTWQFYPQPGDPNPHVDLGIADLSTGEVSWVASSGDDGYLVRAEWSATGDGIYIQLLDRAQHTLRLVKYIPDSVESKTLLTEEDDHWINLEDGGIFPLKDGSFLWSSERSGYRHLYRYSADGSRVQPVTRGSWSVTSVDWVDPEGKSVIVTSTDPDPAQRQVYLVSMETLNRTRLSEGDGFHSIKVSEDGRFMVDSHSNCLMPTRTWVIDRTMKTKSLLDDCATPAYAKLTLPDLQRVEIPTSRGYSIPGLILRPSPLKEGKRYPVLHYVYGGPHAQVTLDRWSSTNLWYTMLVQRGYVIYMVDNRGSAGRGKPWEDAVAGEFGPRELEDQLSGLAYLKDQSWVDKDRITLFGWSYGGFMTLYALTRSAAWAAGIAVAPVTDWMLYDSIYTERYLGLPDQNPEGYKRSSPIHQAEKVRAPLMLAHGFRDDNVHVSHTIGFIDSLIEGQVPYTLYLFPGKSHGIRGTSDRIFLFSRMTDFLETIAGGNSK